MELALARCEQNDGNLSAGNTTILTYNTLIHSLPVQIRPTRWSSTELCEDLLILSPDALVLSYGGEALLLQRSEPAIE